MINIKFTMREKTPDMKNFRGGWDWAFVGLAVDDRGKKAREFVTSLANNVVEYVYDANEMQVVFNGKIYSIEKFDTLIEGYCENKCLVEATTLGVPEIMLASRNMIHSTKINSFDYIYFEPENYQRPKQTNLLSRRDFDLTKRFLGFKGIPGFTSILDNPIRDTVVFFVGYEGYRLASAIDSLSIDKKYCHIVFGVPAFHPGWEIDSFANNVKVICGENQNYGISYCGADNPRATFELLKKMYTTKNDGTDFFVAPLGTKPSAIGVALFCSIYPETSVLYDHPMRQDGRSKSLGSCHLYEIKKY